MTKNEMLLYFYRLHRRPPLGDGNKSDAFKRTHQLTLVVYLVNKKALARGETPGRLGRPCC